MNRMKTLSMTALITALLAGGTFQAAQLNGGSDCAFASQIADVPVDFTNDGSVVGLQFGTLMGGAVVTETIFSLPGLGRLVVDGIFNRDLAVVQGAILTIVLCVVVINLLTDLAYAWLDPRVKL